MDGATAYLLSQGVLGIACIALVSAVVTLYRDNRALQKQINDGLVARLEDQKETMEKVIPVMDSFSQTATLLYSKIRVTKENSGA